MGRIKKSYGIVCCRTHQITGFQLILIKKPITYHFYEFVIGHYKKSNDNQIKKLFNNMTFHEKLDILSLKFATMWYRVFHNNPEQTFSDSKDDMFRQYLRRKVKFEDAFLHDKGVRLKRILSDTMNAETLWEIPKGRRQEQTSEPAINAAIREFSEETMIPQDKYRVLWHAKPYIETYTDSGTTYQNIYYYAVANDNLEPIAKFHDGQQIAEVSAVKWCNLAEVRNMQMDKRVHERLIKMIKKIKQKYKNYLKKMLKAIS